MLARYPGSQELPMGSMRSFWQASVFIGTAAKPVSLYFRLTDTTDYVHPPLVVLPSTCKPDLALGGHGLRCHKLSDGFEDVMELAIMFLELPLEFV
jgi:hypothetical protein